jgi:hypothetical protein
MDTNWKQDITASGMLLFAVLEACIIKGESWQGCSKHCWGSALDHATADGTSLDPVVMELIVSTQPRVIQYAGHVWCVCAASAACTYLQLTKAGRHKML